MVQSHLQPVAFQVRATHLLNTLNWPTYIGSVRSEDNLSTIPNHPNNGPPQSPDVLHKPDMSLATFQQDHVPDASNPINTDDSLSSNSPTPQPRRYSAWDTPTQSNVSPEFAAHDPASLFFTTSESAPVDGGNVLAPAPLLLWAGAPTTCLAHTTSESSLRSSAQGGIPGIVLLQKISPVLGETAHMGRSQTPRQIESLVPFNEPVTSIDTHNSLIESDLSQTLALSLAAPPSSTIQGRRWPVTQLTTTLQRPFCITERSLRLSPSIITRQPMPTLKLPALPSPTPTTERPTEHLRHVPSLTVYGWSGVDQERDSESDDDEGINGGDIDEGLKNENLDHRGGEEGDGDDMWSSLREFRTYDLAPPPITGPSSQRLDSPAAGPTPSFYNAADIISSKSCGKFTYATPSQDTCSHQSFSPKTPLAESINAQGQVLPIHSFELNHARLSMVSREPGLYRMPSRSMIDLSVSQRVLRMKREMSRDTVDSNVPFVSGNTIETIESGSTDRIIGKLLRRTSLPTFTSISDPPRYPSFDPRPQKSTPPVQSPEVEGDERLPPYSNSLYLTAVMPRKMEFSSPGIQAKDRKWRRVICELEGTLLRVYKCPPGVSGAGIIGEWWERHVGVGDLTSGHHAPRQKSDKDLVPPSKIGVDELVASSLPVTSHRERNELQPLRATDRPATPSTSQANRRMSGASFLTPWRNSSPSSRLQSRYRGALPDTGQLGASGGTELLPVSEPSNSRRSSTTAQTMPPLTPRAPSRINFLSSRMRSGEIQKPGKGDLIRAYTLQHAESGLGNDYLKRKNVIRVRLEGEQFLLQAADVPAVVEWIEGFHAGTNIALDLDQRVMPKGPMFPRRRRRRNRPPQDGNNNRARPSH